MSHPCSDFVFDPWADSLLDGCESADADGECSLRLEWVNQRSAQCQVWQSWVVRNHNQHERSDASAPKTRVD